MDEEEWVISDCLLQAEMARECDVGLPYSPEVNSESLIQNNADPICTSCSGDEITKTSSTTPGLNSAKISYKKRPAFSSSTQAARTLPLHSTATPEHQR